MQKTFRIKKNGELDLTRLFAALDKFHKSRASLPFEEKIKILERIKKIAKNMKKARRGYGKFA